MRYGEERDRRGEGAEEDGEGGWGKGVGGDDGDADAYEKRCTM